MLPGDLGLIPIAEALKSATSRAEGKPNVIARGPVPCSPGISRARSRIGPGYFATVSIFQYFPSLAVNTEPAKVGRARMPSNEGLKTRTGPHKTKPLGAIYRRITQGQRTPKTNTGWSKCRFPEQLQVISDCALLHFDCFSDNAGHTMYY